MIKIYPDRIPIRASANKPALARFVDNEWQIKTDGPGGTSDALNQSIAGSYTVLCADGSVIRRTLDAEGFIIHEITIMKGSDK